MIRGNATFLRTRLLPLLAAWAVLLLLAACSGPDGSSSGDPGLLVRLSFSRSHVMVDNGNDFVWKKVTVTIDGKYRYATEQLPRGTSSIPMSEFRDEQGNGFDPRQGAPHRLRVQVQEGFGGKPDEWEW